MSYLKQNMIKHEKENDDYYLFSKDGIEIRIHKDYVNYIENIEQSDKMIVDIDCRRSSGIDRPTFKRLCNQEEQHVFQGIDCGVVTLNDMFIFASKQENII